MHEIVASHRVLQIAEGTSWKPKVDITFKDLPLVDLFPLAKPYLLKSLFTCFKIMPPTRA